MANNELLTRVVNDILTDPHHEQGQWGLVTDIYDEDELEYDVISGYTRFPVDCRTAYCVAGHTCLLAGDQFVTDFEIDLVQRWLRVGEGVEVTEVLTPEGDIRRISDRAQELLGLREHEADLLFGGSNTKADIREYARRIMSGESLYEWERTRNVDPLPMPATV